MQRFKNILVLYSQHEGGDVALSRAAALAKANGARMSVIEVFEKLATDLTAVVAAAPAARRVLEERYVAERQGYLDRLVEPIRNGGVPVTTLVRFGPPFIETIREVISESHDLVVLTADGWQGLRSITFGSTSMHVMRKCPCPVWVIKPEAGRRFERIAAAVNPDPVDIVADELNVKIIELASSLARMEGSHLDILHAWNFAMPERDAGKPEITAKLQQGLFDKTLSAHKAAVDELLENVDLTGIDYDVNLPKGEARDVIPELVQGRQIDLVVMGTVSRTGIAGFLIGATAEDVLRQVDCSVITVKPNGFVTPVTVQRSGHPARLSLVQ